MGYGDCLLASGIARKARERNPGKPICIGDGSQVEWNEVFEGNPFLSREVVPGCVWVHSHKSFRPYVDYTRTTPDKFSWKRDFRAVPGELYLEASELERWSEYSRFVYIEPNVKGWLGPNKDWGFERWQAVVDALPMVAFVQGPGRRLRGVTQVDTTGFRDACALLARADLFAGTDGGLHHAAAALGKKAIVVWGGYTHPRNLGYAEHENLHAGGEPCGNLKPCGHCKRAMERIDPGMVIDAISRVRADAEPQAREVPACV